MERVTFSNAFESPGGTTFDDGKHTMGATINTTPEVVKDTSPRWLLPSTQPLLLWTPRIRLQPFFSRDGDGFWHCQHTYPAKKTHKKRKIPVNEIEEFSDRRDFYQGRVQREEDHPTWNPDRKEKKALPAGANTALGKGKAVAVKEERDNEDDDDHVIAVLGPENPTFSGSDTIILTASLKFEMWLDDKPVPPPGRTQVTAPFDIDNTTNRGSKPSKTVYYHDQGTVYVMNAAHDPQHSSIKISHLHTSPNFLPRP
ncbi:hypothetical protein LTR97_003192 [Elasticomyces elasticus]|uniref:Uncharacterized protein n=1 Tax=Elasticomyces elasticus TaxID=574655 RepID=A0AAN7WFZ9_9PEZI|nr:hypothetical protein LTR97_003192 [Elasticomyces elasticus]